jgi:hypothetical protein
MITLRHKQHSLLKSKKDNPGCFIFFKYGYENVYRIDGSVNLDLYPLGYDAAWEVGVAGNGIFLIFSNDSGGYYAYSEDGAEWHLYPTAPSSIWSTNHWKTAVFGNGMFLIFPEEGDEYIYSEDGLYWNTGTLPFSDYWSTSVFGNGIFLLFSWCEGKYAYSEDGINWREEALPFFQSEIWTCAYGGGIFVVPARDEVVFFSTDGINWNISDNLWITHCVACVYGNGMFMFFPEYGDECAFLREWDEERLLIEPMRIGGTNIENNMSWHTCAYGNGMFWVASYEGAWAYCFGDPEVWGGWLGDKFGLMEFSSVFFGKPTE